MDKPASLDDHESPLGSDKRKKEKKVRVQSSSDISGGWNTSERSDNGQFIFLEVCRHTSLIRSGSAQQKKERRNRLFPDVSLQIRARAS